MVRFLSYLSEIPLGPSVFQTYHIEFGQRIDCPLYHFTITKILYLQSLAHNYNVTQIYLP